jgi:acetoin utilization deacetylase AcuC-like enzyme
VATGFVYHELYMWHDTGRAALWHPAGLTVEPDLNAENADTKRRMRNLLEVSGLLEHLVPLKPRAATALELVRVHAGDYVARIREQSARRGGDAGDGTPFGRGSYEIACLAAGGAIVAVDAVMAGTVRNAYALVRPPGHHAERDRGRGFCIFGNAAVAIRHAQVVHGLERIAVVDWDVHHGNGTQWIFYDDPRVLTLSLHQDRWYPQESGGVDEIGTGAGIGCNINIPLPPGSGREAYLSAFERVVLPALDRYRPQLIVVPSGFDGSSYDPLGRMMLTSATYGRLTRLLMAAADRLCDGRLVCTHEGGYSAAYVPYCGLAVMEALSGHTTRIGDPFALALENVGGHELYPHQAEMIDAAAARVPQVPAP